MHDPRAVLSHPRYRDVINQAARDYADQLDTTTQPDYQAAINAAVDVTATWPITINAAMHEQFTRGIKTIVDAAIKGKLINRKQPQP